MQLWHHLLRQDDSHPIVSRRVAVLVIVRGSIRSEQGAGWRSTRITSVHNCVRHVRRWALASLASALFVGCGGSGEPPPIVYTIHVTNQPAEATTRVGQTVAASLTWRFSSTASNPTSSSYTVSSTTSGVQITNGSGNASPNMAITTELEYACTTIGTVEAQIAIRVSTGNTNVTWIVQCTGQRISTEPLDRTVASVGSAAETELIWRFESEGEDPVALDYSVSSLTQGLTVEPDSGSALPDSAIHVALRHMCEAQGDVTLELSLAVGSATQNVTWEVVCTEETIIVETTPGEAFFSVGDTAQAELIWQYESSFEEPRELIFTVTSSREDLSISNATGELAQNLSAFSMLELQCATPDQIELELTLAVGSATETVLWLVECTEETLLVDVAPSWNSASVGNTASTTVQWRVESSATQIIELDYVIESLTDGLVINDVQGRITTGDVITTQLTYACGTLEQTALELRISSGTATQTLHWSVECTEETVRFDVAPIPISVSVGHNATTTMHWHVESSATRTIELGYMIEGLTDGLVISDVEGRVATGVVMTTELSYACNVSERTALELRISSGTATHTATWEVECSQETIEILMEPTLLRVGNGDREATDMHWRLISTAELPREFNYIVSVNSEQVEVVPKQSVVPTSMDVMTRLIYSCQREGSTEVEVSLEAGNAVATVTWPVVCAKETVVVDAPPQFVSVSFGETATAVMRWYVRSIDSAAARYDYVIESSDDAVIIDIPTGRVVKGSVLTTNLEYRCNSIGRKMFDLSIDIGNVLKKQTWIVECTVETIAFSNKPLPKAEVTVVNNAQVTVDWTLQSSGESVREFDYDVTAAPRDVALSQSTGKVSIGDTISNELTYRCSRAEVFDVSVLVEVGSVEASNTWPVECIVDSIAIVETPASQSAPSGASVTADLVWEFRSSQSGREVLFYVSSSIAGLQIQNGSGAVVAGERVTTSLEFTCSARDGNIELLISAGDQKRTVDWHVDCIGGNEISSMTARFYQGPEIFGANFEEQSGSWTYSPFTPSGTGAQNSRFLRTNRQLFIDVQTQHEEYDSLPISIRLNNHEASLISSNLSQPLGSGYTSQFLFELTDAQFASPGTMNIVIDPNDFYPEPNESNNIVRFPLGSSNTLSMSPFKLKFVPITTTSGTPDLSDVSTFVQPVYELLPVGTVDAEVLSAFNKSNTTWSSSTVDDILDDFYAHILSIDDGQSYHHGIVNPPSGTGSRVCGIAYIGTPAGITAGAPCAATTIAHEIGHNLALNHAPACDAPNSDRNYPYSEGNIGSETGWLMAQGTFVDGTAPADSTRLAYKYYDIMSYCPDRFISQYSYLSALGFLSRQSRGRAAARVFEPPVLGFDAVDGRSVVVTGKVVPESGWQIDEVKVVDIEPYKRYSTEHEYVMQLVDVASGTVLYRENVQLFEVAHSQNKHLRWGIRIPLFEEGTMQLRVFDQQGQQVLDVAFSNQID